MIFESVFIPFLFSPFPPVKKSCRLCVFAPSLLSIKIPPHVSHLWSAFLAVAHSSRSGRPLFPAHGRSAPHHLLRLPFGKTTHPRFRPGHARRTAASFTLFPLHERIRPAPGLSTGRHVRSKPGKLHVSGLSRPMACDRPKIPALHCQRQTRPCPLQTHLPHFQAARRH